MLVPGNALIRVTWTAVPAGNNGGAAVTSYTVSPFNLTTGGGLVGNRTCTAFGASTTTCTLMNLINGNRYRVVVRATNKRGDSIASDSVSATLGGVFGSGAAIADQTYIVGLPVDTVNSAGVRTDHITLPAATEGIYPYTYILTRSDRGTPVLPSGLNFDPRELTISGKPLAAFDADLVYTATDSDSPANFGTVNFNLTVNEDSPLILGTVGAFNLNLRYPVTINDHTATTADDKTYYYLDNNNNCTGEQDDGGSVGDLPVELRTLLNRGNAISDDARSVIVGDYTLVLPTVAEMEALRTDLNSQIPAGWFRVAPFPLYLTATVATDTPLTAFNLRNGRAFGSNTAWPVVFQVLVPTPTAPTTEGLLFKIKVFLEGAQVGATPRPRSCQ